MKITLSLLAVFTFLSVSLEAQRQYADSSYVPPPFPPTYSGKKAPLLCIDEAHHNFHTREGRYSAFARMVELDGFHSASFSGPVSKKNLRTCDILVISNALPPSSLEKWEAPTASAFSADEIAVLEHWVRKGGSLFLIADHMPMGGAARELAAAFGFTFYDAFANNENTPGGSELFLQADGSLSSSELITGSEHFFEVDSVRSFTGQAFEIPEGATSLLNCGEGWISLMPEVAWQFNDSTPKLDSEGWSQGAILEYGKGKLAVFGEAAMFSAQIAEIEDRVIYAGMNNPHARRNYQLLLNLVRWLGE